MPQGGTGLTLSSPGCTGSAQHEARPFADTVSFQKPLEINSPTEQRLCVHVHVCMEGQTDSVPLCYNGVYTRGNELPASPVTVCRHRPAAVCSLSTNSSAEMFPECHASFAALLQAGIFSRPLSLPFTLPLGQPRAEVLPPDWGEPTARPGLSCYRPCQHPDARGDHPCSCGCLPSPPSYVPQHGHCRWLHPNLPL